MRIFMHMLLLFGVMLCVGGPAFTDDQVRPDPNLTPGDALPGVTTAALCQPGYAKSVRHVDGRTRARVYRQYGIKHDEGVYEIDHLISIELGGSNDIRNLWPESFNTQPWNARRKDRLEDHLHRLVCEGQLSLSEAQEALARDWILAYQKYVEGASQPPSGDCVIKGNVNHKRERIYHLPGQLDYPEINMAQPGKRWFCSEEEAKAAGWRPAAR